MLFFGNRETAAESPGLKAPYPVVQIQQPEGCCSFRPAGLGGLPPKQSLDGAPGQIELRGWAEFVSESPQQATLFLNREVAIDAQELDKQLRKAFPAAVLAALPNTVNGKRFEPARIGESVDHDFKLCSKLIHPSALMLNHPEMTISNDDIKAHLRVEVLLYAWVIVARFHNLNWQD